MHNIYANKTASQIQYYLRNFKIYVAFRGREVVEKLNELYNILILKLSQSRLPHSNRLEITFELTNEEINSWLTGTPFNFEGDVYGPKNSKDGLDYKIRPRFVDENFQSRHTHFEIQNEWGIQDLPEFLQIIKKPTFGLLKKWLRQHEGIRANFCITATYKRVGHIEII